MKNESTKNHPAASDAELVQTLRLKPPDEREPHNLADLTLAQLQHLVDDFDLGRIIRMDEALTTQCNITEPFRTGQGTFMVRIRHGEDFGERVAFIHAVMRHLRNCGLPVCEVMSRPNGSTWTLWGDRIVEIHRYIAHEPGLNRDWRRMLAAASSLGDLHKALQTYRSDAPPVPPEMRNDLLPAECWNMIPHAERNLEKYCQRASPEDAAIARGVLAEVREAIVPLLDEYERVLGNLPWMFVHGDFHFWNLLYRSDDVVGIVDFDFLQERERLFDVAYAMQAILGYMNYIEGTEPAHFSTMHWDNLRLWLDLYDDAAHKPLSEFERRRLPLEILRIFLVNAVVSATQPDPVPSLLQSAIDMPLFRWLAAQDGFFIR